MHPVTDHRLAVDQRRLVVDFLELAVGKPEIGVFDLGGGAAAEAQLIEARALAHPDREGARRDLRVERPAIGGLDRIEHLAVVGDEAGEDVEAAGGALRVGDARDAFGKVEALLQLDHIDAAPLQDRALLQRHPIERQIIELVGHAAPGAGQEARPHPVGGAPQPQIEARGLELGGLDLFRRADHPPADQRDHPLARIDAHRRADAGAGALALLAVAALEQVVGYLAHGTRGRSRHDLFAPFRRPWPGPAESGESIFEFNNLTKGKWGAGGAFSTGAPQPFPSLTTASRQRIQRLARKFGAAVENSLRNQKGPHCCGPP